MIDHALGRVALPASASPRPGPNGDAAIGPLTRRECEVARLVTQGLSNREVGRTLGISERTVDAHVQHILNKLGFSSRTQVAAWVAASSSAAAARGPAASGLSRLHPVPRGPASP
jgi:DNA-binding NarL/FixJ family response regulator